ncbi:MAG: heme exporter protein CcmB [bacterium]|jgi:heme exporter protein B
MFRQLAILVWKDVLIDLRRKENLISLLLFSILTLLIFNFAAGDPPQAFQKLIPGLIWVVFLMSGTLALGKSFVQEMETGCIGGLLLAPMDRSLLFLGKTLANLIFLLISQSIFIALSLFFFAIPPQSLGHLFLVLLAGSLGFSALGTVLTAMTAALRGREVLLPILLFPLMVPSVISLVHLSSFLLFGEYSEEVGSWWKLLLGNDALLIIASTLGFELVTEE